MRQLSRLRGTTLAGLAVGAMVLAGCGEEAVDSGPGDVVDTSTSASTSPGSSIPATPSSSSSTPGGPGIAAGKLTARLELESTTVKAGGSVKGSLVVDNGSDRPVKVVNESGSCGPKLGLGFEGSNGVRVFPGHNDRCDPPLVFPPGTTRLPLATRATHASCASGSDLPGMPACRTGGGGSLPYLPGGQYKVVVHIDDSTALGPIAPVSITVIGEPGTTPPPAATPKSATTRQGLKVHLEAPTYVVVGSTTPTVLVVENPTKANVAVLDGGCTPKLGIEWRGPVTVTPAFTAECGQSPLLVKPGVNRFPIQATAAHISCTRSTPVPTDSLPCPKTGMPLIPAGTYTWHVIGAFEETPPATVVVKAP